MSDDPLEARLRSALEHEAAAVHPHHDAWSRFEHARASRPGGTEPDALTPPVQHDLAARRRPRPVAFAAAAAVITLLAAGAGSDLLSKPAYASWASSPDIVDAVAASRIAQKCGLPHPAVIDRRGSTAYVMATSAHASRNCLVTVPGTRDEGLGATYVAEENTPDSTRTTPDANHPMVVISVKPPEGNHVAGEPEPVEYVSGRVHGSVARVTVTTSQGVVTATRSGDAFGAWWPGNDAESATIRAYDASGRLLATASHLTDSRGAIITPEQ